MTNVKANDLSVLFYENAEVRMVMIEEEPWWVLTDVCKALDISHVTDVVNRLEEDEVGLSGVIDTLGREQKTYLVNEWGLYNVIMRSDKPSAKAFRKWVTHEVLPNIRKYGKYSLKNVENGQNMQNEQEVKLLNVANIISRCPKERLPFVYHLISEAGFDVPGFREYISTKQKLLFIPDCSPEDIKNYVDDFAKKYGVSLHGVSRLSGVPYTTLLRYYKGKIMNPEGYKKFYECLKKYEIEHEPEAVQ